MHELNFDSLGVKSPKFIFIRLNKYHIDLYVNIIIKGILELHI